MVFSTHRFRGLASLTPADELQLRNLGEAETRRRRGETFQREGDRVTGIYLNVSGWVASSITVRRGDRLIQKVHLPGDMLSTPSMVLAAAADTLTALTEVTTAFVPLERLGELFNSAPRLAALFTMAVQMERLALIDTLAAAGRASAKEQIARLLLDLHTRLTPLNLVRNDTFDLPITQAVMGDLLGLTSVHVNRTLRSLEKDRLINFDRSRGTRVHLVDVAKLRDLSPLRSRAPLFEASWLPKSR